MMPTPRRLALLMSLAGLGASLGEAVQARTHAVPYARLEVATELPVAVVPEALQPWSEWEDGSPFALPTPLDGTFEAADEYQPPQEALVAVEPRNPFAITADDPASAASDRDTEARAKPVASTSLLRQEESIADVAEKTDSAIAAEESTGLFTPYPQRSAVRVGSALGSLATRVDIEFDLATAIDPAADSRPDIAPIVEAWPEWPAALDLRLDTSPYLAPSSILAADPHAAADGVLDINLDLGPSVDLNLDLAPGLDLNLDLIASLDINLDLGRNIDVNLDMLAEPHLHFVAPPVATKQAPSGAASTVAAPFAPSASRASCIDERSPWPVVGTPEIVVVPYGDRVLHRIEALMSQDGPASGPFGAPPEVIFVATQEEKVLRMLAAIVERAERANRREAETQFEPPPTVDAAARKALKAEKTAPAPVAESTAATAASPPVREAFGPSHPAETSAMGDRLALNESRLDQVRGGFQTAGGLQMSFGIERAVHINGSLVTTTSLNIVEAGNAAGVVQAPGLASTAAGNLTLIQNGGGNAFVTGPISPTSLSTVVQNTLNDQKIQNITSINATVNSLQLMKAQNFESSLRGAIVNSLRR